MEARLIKDIQPKHNHDLKDDKTFPYLQITTGEDFPRVNFTRAAARSGREALRAVPAGQEPARGDPGLAEDLQVPHLLARHRGGRPTLAVVPALPARTRSTSAPPRATCGSTARPTGATSAGSGSSSTARRTSCSRRWRRRCSEASKELQFEKAARLRDEIKALETLNLRGDLAKHAQPEVFYVDPRKGLKGLKKILKLESMPRTIDGVDIAHLGGTETVGSLVTFIDGLPFKPGYRRYKIKSVAGIDDFASIREVVTPADPGPSGARRAVPRHLPDRRRQGAAWRGPGRVRGAEASCRRRLISLAKREEEIYIPGRSEPIVLSRRSFALRLLAIRPRRGPPLRRSITTTCSGRSDALSDDE